MCTHASFLQEVAVSGDLAAAQAASTSAEPHSDGSSNSTASHQDLWDSQSPRRTQQKSPFSAQHAPSSFADGGTESGYLKGAAPRTPMSPQPSKPPRPALTRQLSKSAPSSPHCLPNASLHAPEAYASSPTCDANGHADSHASGYANSHASSYANGHTNHGSETLGSIRIPGRGGQVGLSNQVSGSLGGSVGGSDGGLNGLSPPDGYMADSELASSRHRLQHSSVSFNSSGEHFNSHAHMLKALLCVCVCVCEPIKEMLIVPMPFWEPKELVWNPNGLMWDPSAQHSASASNVCAMFVSSCTKTSVAC